MLCAVRGATTAQNNSADAIETAVSTLIETLINRNEIAIDRIVSVFFTITPDLTALNPARAIRTTRSDWKNVPMLCSQEPQTEGMLPRCIRVLIQWDSEHPERVATPAYLGEASQLRPDLAGD